MKIPCETIVRLSHIMQGWTDETKPEFRTVRIEDRKIICTDRKFMVMEHVPSAVGTHHLVLDDALIEQCRTESQFGGQLELVCLPGMAMAKSTFGYQTGNLAYVGPTPEFDRWPEIIASARGDQQTAGVMVWDADDVARIAAASPSGTIEFPRVIDATALSIVIRDVSTHDWCGFFHPKVSDGMHRSGAVVPGWV